jgi:hypothetical protein
MKRYHHAQIGQLIALGVLLALLALAMRMT